MFRFQENFELFQTWLLSFQPRVRLSWTDVSFHYLRISEFKVALSVKFIWEQLFSTSNCSRDLMFPIWQQDFDSLVFRTFYTFCQKKVYLHYFYIFFRFFIGFEYFWVNLNGFLRFWPCVAYPVQRTWGVVHWRSGSVNHSINSTAQVDSTAFNRITNSSELLYTCGSKTKRGNYHVQGQKGGRD